MHAVLIWNITFAPVQRLIISLWFVTFQFKETCVTGALETFIIRTKCLCKKTNKEAMTYSLVRKCEQDPWNVSHLTFFFQVTWTLIRQSSVATVTIIACEQAPVGDSWAQSRSNGMSRERSGEEGVRVPLASLAESCTTLWLSLARSPNFFPPLLGACSQAMTISNGNRTEWSSIRSVII